MKNKLLILVVLVFPPLSSAYADMTVAQYNKIQRGTEAWTLAELYIGGMAEGLEWANAELETKGRQPLFCTPDKLPMTRGGYVAILDNYLQRPDVKRKTEGKPELSYVGIFLLSALCDTFPCR